jgi:hypothetical protein
MLSWGFAPSFSAQVRFGEPGAPVIHVEVGGIELVPVEGTEP